MVFGDGKNDVPMLKNAGFGVAMGNACPEAKAAAANAEKTAAAFVCGRDSFRSSIACR